MLTMADDVGKEGIALGVAGWWIALSLRIYNGTTGT